MDRSDAFAAAGYDPEVALRAKCCGCTEAFQASRAGSIPVARLRDSHGEWRSLVAHPAGGRAVAGSNPVSPIRREARNSAKARSVWTADDYDADIPSVLIKPGRYDAVARGSSD
jgi:hypothetical protein